MKKLKFEVTAGSIKSGIETSFHVIQKEDARR